MKKPLTKKQELVYGFIRKYIKQNKKSPTMEEVQIFLDVKSINSISQYLEALEKGGYLSRRRHDKRNIDLVEVKNNDSKENKFIQIPVVASVGCDNLSTFAEENADRAVGNSMNDAGIENGDYVLIDQNAEIQNGDKVVAIVGGMATLKRFEKKESLAVLWPESKDKQYKPIIINQDFKLAGKVISVIPRQFYDDVQIIPN